jgi:hypothetical protein
MAALGGPVEEMHWLKAAEDLAFLVFIANFGEWPRWMKEGMLAAVDIPDGAITVALTQDYGRRSGTILYPLRGLESSRRSELLRWVMCYLEQRDTRQQRDLLALLNIEPTTKGLFRALDDAGREEFVCRASRWPERLRRPVREVMYMAWRQSSGPNHDFRDSWAMSSARRHANNGKIPQCYKGMSEKLVRKLNPGVDYLYESRKHLRKCLQKPI